MLSVHRNQFLPSFDLLCATVQRVMPRSTLASARHGAGWSAQAFEAPTASSASSSASSSGSSGGAAPPPLTRYSLYLAVLTYRSVEHIPALKGLFPALGFLPLSDLLLLLKEWKTQIERYLTRVCIFFIFVILFVLFVCFCANASVIASGSHVWCRLYQSQTQSRRCVCLGSLSCPICSVV